MPPGIGYATYEDKPRIVDEKFGSEIFKSGKDRFRLD